MTVDRRATVCIQSTREPEESLEVEDTGGRVGEQIGRSLRAEMTIEPPCVRSRTRGPEEDLRVAPELSPPKARAATPRPALRRPKLSERYPNQKRSLYRADATVLTRSRPKVCSPMLGKESDSNTQ